MNTRNLTYDKSECRRLHRALRLAFATLLVAGAATFAGRVQANGSAGTQLVLPMVPQKPHCVVGLDPTQYGQSESVGYVKGCYATIGQAVSAATGGAVTLPPGIPPNRITQRMLIGKRSSKRARTFIPYVDTKCHLDNNANNNTCNGTVIAIDYENTYFGGASLTWFSTVNGGCNNGADSFGITSMPSGWDKVVSSAHSYATCYHFKHFQYASYGQPLVDCNPTCYPLIPSNTGNFNDQTSSETLNYYP